MEAALAIGHGCHEGKTLLSNAFLLFGSRNIGGGIFVLGHPNNLIWYVTVLSRTGKYLSSDLSLYI